MPPVTVEKNGTLENHAVITRKQVVCARTTAYVLVLIALAAVVLSALISFWITKEIYDRSLEIRPFAEQLNDE